MKGYWYLASPYSKYPNGTEAAFHDVCAVAARLLKNGVHVYSPIAHSHPIAQHGMDEKDHETWLALDKHFVDASIGVMVVMLAGWEESYGVQKEIEWAKDAGKEVRYIEP